MQSSSRRAFLTGRRGAQTPWEAFCRAMRRAVEGSFFEFELPGAEHSARLIPKQATDVLHARKLCAEHGVLFALDGVPQAARLDEQPVLWVEPGRDLSACRRLEAGSSKWFVQPGCLLGELEAAGLAQFSDMPCHLSVAAWLADRTLCDWEAGATAKSGIVHASVLLADGASVSLGAFGERNTKPLQGARLQQLIPALFRLAAGPDAQACRLAGRWPARYRLDALLPAPGRVVNLAHLLLGHGGDLGWIEWVVIDEGLAEPLGEPPYSERYTPRRAEESGVGLQASELDAGVKSLFDPSFRLPFPGQDL
ncbi:hypothetical protein [Parapusillimonas granuli]|uniref:FAD-binding protein n=1 Tax=Parapusillimonas granuli TaxID=380911 RepID=A0A853FXY6_9BURK|nr:hypothetical protein [Parapusillimonas granuli]MBB5215155.1 hypothetical protein [Parapusillimonas granuli]MEB2401809.1 hypothetical protein [Alcaligenaceae bacterium]NYT49473.1 hypothetical protein [Parapusillimonas granuli]